MELPIGVTMAAYAAESTHHAMGACGFPLSPVGRDTFPQESSIRPYCLSWISSPHFSTEQGPLCSKIIHHYSIGVLKKAFTLIEFLIVIAVIAGLMGILMSTSLPGRSIAEDRRTKGNVSILDDAPDGIGDSRRYDSYKGLIMTGYPGWFNAPGDGADKDWTHYHVVFESAMQAATKYNRAISIRYDLAGMGQECSQVLLVDLDEMIEKYDMFERVEYPTFLHHNGKPLIAIGGVGFSDDIAGIDDIGYLNEAEMIIVKGSDQILTIPLFLICR